MKPAGSTRGARERRDVRGVISFDLVNGEVPVLGAWGEGVGQNIIRPVRGYCYAIRPNS